MRGERQDKFKNIFFEKLQVVSTISPAIFKKVSCTGSEFISLADFLEDTGNRRILGKGRKALRIDQTKTMRLISVFGLDFFLSFSKSSIFQKENP